MELQKPAKSWLLKTYCLGSLSSGFSSILKLIGEIFGSSGGVESGSRRESGEALSGVVATLASDESGSARTTGSGDD